MNLKNALSLMIYVHMLVLKFKRFIKLFSLKHNSLNNDFKGYEMQTRLTKKIF